ncbi:MAG: hypothetical protein AAGI91_17295 [Bacteroidota bacterium]
MNTPRFIPVRSTRTRRRLGVPTAVALLALTVAACDSAEVAPPPVAEFESAVVFNYRLQDPDGYVNFVGVYEDVPTELDLSTMIEAGGDGSSVISLGDEIFVYDGVSTYTKFTVDRTDLSLTADDRVIDLSRAGVTGEIGNPVFVGDNEVYLIDSANGVIVEIDPEAMEIVETINFPPTVAEGWTPFTGSGASFSTFHHYVTAENLVIAVVASFDTADWTQPYATTLMVFDPATNQVTFNSDDRVPSSYSQLIEMPDGSFFLDPYWSTSIAETYGNHDSAEIPSGNVMLRILPDGTFDPNFEIDLGETAGFDYVRDVPFVLGDEAVVNHYPAGTAAPDDWIGIFSIPTVATAVNLQTGATRPFTALDGYTAWGPLGKVGNTEYFFAYPPDSITDEDNFEVLRQNGLTSYTTVIETPGGDVRWLAQLWGPEPAAATATVQTAEAAPRVVVAR